MVKKTKTMVATVKDAKNFLKK